METDACLQERNVPAWQAVTVIFWKLFKEKLTLASNRTECFQVKPPQELTTEALSMIVVITVFMAFAFLGCLHTIFEVFREEKAERKNPRKKTDTKNFTNLSKKDWISSGRSFLQCFCFVKNGKKLFQPDNDKMQFECFHGIRVISNISIILNHIALYIIYAKRSDEIKLFSQTPIAKLLYNACFAVDAFLVLSGFLNACSFSTEYDKKNGKMSWWNFYLKRFVRLTPAYMIVFGFYTTLLNYTGSGPIWPKYATNPVCKKNWWRYLFYINNFELIANSCMVWCWQVATEMQLYIASPIFLLLLLRWRILGYVLTSLIIFLSGLGSFLVTMRFNLIYGSFIQFVFYNGDVETFMVELWRYTDALYFKPYTRMSSYLIGVLLGQYMYNKNFKDIRNRWTVLCFGWIAAGILIWISLFGVLKKEESLLETALYNSVKHLFYSVGLSWIIFVCLTKQGRFLNTFLSWKLFLPLSKLSYCAYLIHMLIIQRDYQAAQKLEEFCFLSTGFYLFRVYFWTIVCSIPVCLLFEMPMINLFVLYTTKEEDERREDGKRKMK